MIATLVYEYRVFEDKLKSMFPETHPMQTLARLKAWEMPVQAKFVCIPIIWTPYGKRDPSTNVVSYRPNPSTASSRSLHVTIWSLTIPLAVLPDSPIYPACFARVRRRAVLKIRWKRRMQCLAVSLPLKPGFRTQVSGLADHLPDVKSHGTVRS